MEMAKTPKTFDIEILRIKCKGPYDKKTQHETGFKSVGNTIIFQNGAQGTNLG